jgi:nuclear pore complex protein Nup155
VYDAARGCFYTLTESAVISVWQTSGDKAVQVEQTINNIYKYAQDKAPGSPLLTPSSFTIVSVEAVHPSESRAGFQLVAITGNGVRLYFSSTSLGYGGYSYGSSSSGGRSLQLTHVRLPPTELTLPEDAPGIRSGLTTGQPSGHIFSMSGIENFCYSLGVTIACQPGDTESRDYVLCMSPDLTRIGSFGQVNQQPPEPPLYNGISNGPQRPPLAEYATLHHIPGRTWAVAAVQQSLSSGLPATHELGVQFSEPSRQFMILTSSGITFLAKRRPLDYLRDVIEDFHAEGNVQSMLHFRDRWILHCTLGSITLNSMSYLVLDVIKLVQCYLHLHAATHSLSLGTRRILGTSPPLALTLRMLLSKLSMTLERGQSSLRG